MRSVEDAPLDPDSCRLTKSHQEPGVAAAATGVVFKVSQQDAEILAKDIKSKLNLQVANNDECKLLQQQQQQQQPQQTNGTCHPAEQMNGTYETLPQENTASSGCNIGTPETNCQVETSHYSQTSDTQEGMLQASKDCEIVYVSYTSELQMPDIMKLIQKDLSEPYSIYTYRYFIHNWPKLCFLAMDGTECIGAIVCKLDLHRKVTKRGYIAMLAVDIKYRKRKIGSNLVRRAIQAMIEDDADEVVLETEITNQPALRLYENLGFVRDKRLFRYYLNGVDALRLKLWLR